MLGKTGKKKVLIVDDEPVIRRLVYGIMINDYTVIEAPSGEEAVKLACNEKPDIILMDIMMPGMDGMSACLKIKQDRTIKNTPVVMLSAIGYELNKKLSQDIAGASAYITKPFSRQELLNTVGQLLVESSK
jgi:two-component system, OmpR family, alkaline phosphatase synthesis response regulator PhoP